MGMEKKKRTREESTVVYAFARTFISPQMDFVDRPTSSSVTKSVDPASGLRLLVVREHFSVSLLFLLKIKSLKVSDGFRNFIKGRISQFSQRGLARGLWFASDPRSRLR